MDAYLEAENKVLDILNRGQEAYQKAALSEPSSGMVPGQENQGLSTGANGSPAGKIMIYVDFRNEVVGKLNEKYGIEGWKIKLYMEVELMLLKM